MNQNKQTRDSESTIIVACVRFEQRDNIGRRGPTRPQISWSNLTMKNGWQQTGYQIEARSADGGIVNLMR